MPVEFLSPSALAQFEEDPVDFYLRRMSSVPAPKIPQTLAMAAGSAFDALVKAALAKQIPDHRPIEASVLLVNQVEPQHRDEATKIGLKLMSAYKRLGCLKALLEEGILECDPQCDNIEVPDTHRELLGRRVAGIPIKGHPDARGATKDEVPIPWILDWKVTGAEGNSGSVHPGWKRLYDTNDAMAYRLHPHPRHEEPLDTLNLRWASQLATYRWLLQTGTARCEGFKDARVAIDQIVVTEGRVRVAQIRTVVTGEFQVQLRQRYVTAWEKIRENKVLPEELASMDPETLRCMRGA